MEFEITKETENPLFKRKEIQLSVEAETTPSEKEMLEAIAQKFSTQADNISMKGIHGKFGSKTFTVTANIYESAEEKNLIETKKKKGAEEAKPATEGEAPAAPVETPAEAPKVEEPASSEQKPADADDKKDN
jgi:ribosomal protein S24E